MSVPDCNLVEHLVIITQVKFPPSSLQTGLGPKWGEVDGQINPHSNFLLEIPGEPLTLIQTRNTAIVILKIAVIQE